MCAKKARAFCFTNFKLDFDYKVLKSRASYIIIGLETCPKSKRLHHQGYARFPNAVSVKQLRTKILPKINHTIANGNDIQNYNYCTKDGNLFLEQGTRPQQGKRNDIHKVKELLANGGSMRDVIEITNSYQAMRCAELILKYKEKPRDQKPIVKWYWGKTGTGKSKQAFEETKDPWVSGKNLKWWEGYDAHDDVIIDDFRKDFCTFHELLRILDRYPYRVENKGGSRQLRAKKIIITTPFSPLETYDTREDVQQLIRRIDVIRPF